MEVRDVVDLRLRNQRLTGKPLSTPEAVVAWLGAVQSQEHGLAPWSIGLRADRLTDADVRDAIDEGRVLRTHVLRPTWHYLAADDIRWIMELTAPRVEVANRPIYRRLGLDDELLRRTNRILADALADAHLTRVELRAALARHGITPDNLGLAYIVMRAELDLVLCSGPMRGRQQTYALVDERAPRARSLPRDEALAELTRRYFTSRGPATLRDFRWWSSLLVSDIRRGIELVGVDLESRTIDGVTYWMAPDAVEERPDPAPGHLLQAYDEYFMAYSQSRGHMALGAAAGAAGDDSSPYFNVAIVGGLLNGRWRRLPMRDGAFVLEFSGGPPEEPETRDAVERAADHYRRFLGTALHVRWGEASV